MRFLDDARPLGGPRPVEVIDRGRRPRHHETDLARARSAGRGVFAILGPAREKIAVFQFMRSLLLVEQWVGGRCWFANLIRQIFHCQICRPAGSRRISTQQERWHLDVAHA